MRPLAYTLRASPGVLVGLHVGESLATREAATPDPPSDSPRSLYVTNGTAPRARTYARDRESSPAPRSGIHARNHASVAATAVAVWIRVGEVRVSAQAASRVARDSPTLSPKSTPGEARSV